MWLYSDYYSGIFCLYQYLLGFVEHDGFVQYAGGEEKPRTDRCSFSMFLEVDSGSGASMACVAETPGTLLKTSAALHYKKYFAQALFCINLLHSIQTTPVL